MKKRSKNQVTHRKCSINGHTYRTTNKDTPYISEDAQKLEGRKLLLMKKEGTVTIPQKEWENITDNPKSDISPIICLGAFLVGIALGMIVYAQFIIKNYG